MKQVVMAVLIAALATGCGSLGKSKVINYDVGADGKATGATETYKTNTLARAENAARVCGVGLAMEKADGKPGSGGSQNLIAEVPQTGNAAPIKIYAAKDSSVVRAERDGLVNCVAAFMETTGKVIARELGATTREGLRQFPLLSWLFFPGRSGGTTVDASGGSHVELYDRGSPRNQEGQQGIVHRDGDPSQSQTQDKSQDATAEGATAIGTDNKQDNSTTAAP